MTIDIESLELDEWGLTEEEQKEFNELENVDAEYSSKSDFSKADLAFECFKKVFFLRAVEMRKGYYNYTYLKDGNELKTWVPDSRKEYISSVKALKLILSPELQNDPEINKKIAALLNLEEKIWEKFAYNELAINHETGNYEETNVVFMPEPDTSVVIKQGEDKYVEVEGAWALKIEHYWNALVEVYDNIFSQLNLLIHKNNYFKGKTLVG